MHRHHQRGREDGTDEGAAGSTQQTGRLQEGTTHNPLVYITLNNLRLRHSPNNKLGHYEVYYSYNMYFLWFSPLSFPFLLPVSAVEHVVRYGCAAGRCRGAAVCACEGRASAVAKEAAEGLHWSPRQHLPGPAGEVVQYSHSPLT